MHSKKVDGKLWVACCECDRGGNGSARDKCSCGGFTKKWDKLGCFLGDLESQKRKEQNVHQSRPLQVAPRL